MTSPNGERVDFESLEFPRPVPDVTLKKNWQSQQQQYSSSCTDVSSSWKCSWGITGPEEYKTVRNIPLKWDPAQCTLGRVLLTWKQILSSRGWYHRHDLTDWSCERRGGYRSHGQNLKRDLYPQFFKMKNMMFRPSDCWNGQCRINWTEANHSTCSRKQHMLCGNHIRSNPEMIQRIRKALDVLKTLSFRHIMKSERLQAWVSIVTTVSSLASMKMEILEATRWKVLLKNEADMATVIYMVWETFARHAVDEKVRIQTSNNSDNRGPTTNRDQEINIVHIEKTEGKWMTKSILKFASTWNG